MTYWEMQATIFYEWSVSVYCSHVLQMLKLRECTVRVCVWGAASSHFE